LGLNKIKTELEDLSFKYEHPEEYAQIESKLQETQAEREEVFREFTAPIRAQLDKMGISYQLIARVKSPYSIWNKMQTKHITFEEIYDILAVRIIFCPKKSGRRTQRVTLTYTYPYPRFINRTQTACATG
jgi:GTP diphosphokinase